MRGRQVLTRVWRLEPERVLQTPVVAVCASVVARCCDIVYRYHQCQPGAKARTRICVFSVCGASLRSPSLRSPSSRHVTHFQRGLRIRCDVVRPSRGAGQPPGGSGLPSSGVSVCVRFRLDVVARALRSERSADTSSRRSPHASLECNCLRLMLSCSRRPPDRCRRRGSYSNGCHSRRV
jgi:hypothetical protein